MQTLFDGSTLVLKFGGASLQDARAIGQVASIIARRKREVKHLAVVVSAMGKMTDLLHKMAYEVHPHPPERELDMLVTVGERISVSLLAMALARVGLTAKSFTGSQSGIITTSAHQNAEILEVRPQRILEAFAKGYIAIVCGFQGMSIEKEITTLGRGGSDTSAVALAVALDASHVEFYKDVDGVYAKDPKCFPEAKHFAKLSYREAKQLASLGHPFLHLRAIERAERFGLPLKVLSFQKERTKSTEIGVEQRLASV